MAPTALIGDVLLIDPRLRPALGDVVVAQVDAGTRIQVIKRVAAVAGDVIGCPADSAGDCHGLVVNGRDVPEPYLVGGAGAAFGPVRVPAGDVFLLGDNRADSADSRQWGPVPASDVEGVALTITTPGRHSRTVVGAPAHRQPGGGGDVGPVQPPPPAAAIPAG
jgi:signal peptidase I